MINNLNIIHLPERVDRWGDLMGMLIENGITDFSVWDGVKHKRYPKLGILQAHKKIVAYAKEKGLPYVHIAEDDIRFFGNGAWEYYLSQLPKECDMFFSMIYAGKIEDGKMASKCSGMTMYTVYERFYDFFLSVPEENGGHHVDRYLTGFYDRFDFRVCDPFVCEQTGSKSDNSKMKIDYRPLLKNRKLFGQ